MNKRALLIAAALTIGGASALGAHAHAGGVLDRNYNFLMPFMGIRVISVATYADAPRKSFKAQVVNAERFASRGYPGAKVNDEVTIVQLGERRGTVKHNKSGKAHNFRVKDDGTVEKE